MHASEIAKKKGYLKGICTENTFIPILLSAAILFSF
jgi:hypothetical protein